MHKFLWKPMAWAYGIFAVLSLLLTPVAAVLRPTQLSMATKFFIAAPFTGGLFFGTSIVGSCAIAFLVFMVLLRFEKVLTWGLKRDVLDLTTPSIIGIAAFMILQFFGTAVVDQWFGHVMVAALFATMFVCLYKADVLKWKPRRVLAAV